jgi:hypothetical protein
MTSTTTTTTTISSSLTTIFNWFYHTWRASWSSQETTMVLLGQSANRPLPTRAVPGLMTLLDVALYRTVEGQLTGLVCTAHALLAAWLDLKQQAAIVMKAAKYELSDAGVILSSSSTSSSTNTSSASLSLLRPAIMEGFARACFDAACDAIERITTDRLAISANLSDPYESGSSSSSSAAAAGGGGGPSSATPSTTAAAAAAAAGIAGSTGPLPTSVGGSGGNSSGSSSNADLLAAALQDSSLDTGRRDATLQRPRDCWETSRLLCPDYVWADDVCSYCQRLLRQLSKHAYVTIANAMEQGKNSRHHGSLLESPSAVLFGAASSSSNSSSSSSSSSGYTERHAALLLQLLQTDISCRLLQFRSAVEAESVVAKPSI